MFLPRRCGDCHRAEERVIRLPAVTQLRVQKAPNYRNSVGPIGVFSGRVDGGEVQSRLRVATRGSIADGGPARLIVVGQGDKVASVVECIRYGLAVPSRCQTQWIRFSVQAGARARLSVGHRALVGRSAASRKNVGRVEMQIAYLSQLRPRSHRALARPYQANRSSSRSALSRSLSSSRTDRLCLTTGCNVSST